MPLDIQILDLAKEIPQHLKNALAYLTPDNIASFIQFYREYAKYINDTETESSNLAYLSYVQKFGDNIVDIVKLKLAQKPITPELNKREENK